MPRGAIAIILWFTVLWMWPLPCLGYPLALDGTPTDVRVTDPETRVVIFEGISTGRSSQPLHLIAAAPPGAVLRVEAARELHGAIDSAWPIEFARNGSFHAVLPFLRSEIASKVQDMRTRYPGESDADIEAHFGMSMHELLRRELTVERAYLDLVEARTLLQRDSCRESSLRVRVTVDLTNVAPERYLGDFVVAVSLTALPASRDQRTLYKPFSERSSSLAVILLAITQGSGNYAFITQWRAGRPVIVRSTHLAESPYFGNGGLYARYYLRRTKRRQSVTIERVSIDRDRNVLDAFGVCVRLDERRQQVNGFR